MMSIQPHERLLQTLSAMLIQLNVLQTQVSTEPQGGEQAAPDVATLRTSLHTLEQMTREALHIARSSVDDLLPELEGVVLSEALTQIVEETAERLNLSSRIAFSGSDEQGRSGEHMLSYLAGRLLYLVAREALYQVELHSGARRLRFSLNYGRDDVQMRIEDDGAKVEATPSTPEDEAEDVATLAVPPFDTQVATMQTAHVSVSIMNDLRYRIELLGGTLEARFQESQGMRVLVRIPYEPHVHDEKASGPEKTTPVAQQAAVEGETAPVDTISVLVVDNQAVTRAGLSRLLDSYAGLQVIGQASDGIQAVSETMELGPQVVLMDAQLPDGQSLEALRQIKQLNPDTRVLMLSTQDREDYLYETLRAGADGFVLKDIAPDELAQAIRAVARGEVLIQPQLAGKLLSRFGKQGRNVAPYETLTARELEVLRLLAEGLRNKEIAARLSVSERTVNFHLANIYQKLNVSGRTEALRRAIEQRLIFQS